VKAAAVALAFSLASIAWAQPSTAPQQQRVFRQESIRPATKQFSPTEKLWCPVIKSALSGAAAAEPPVRSYLLDAVAGGLSRCDPAKVRRVLVDSFIATLSIPETQDEVDKQAGTLVSAGERLDQATAESISHLEAKRTLQGSALVHLLTVDEAKVESLLLQAEPDVRSNLLNEMIARATSAKKFTRAIALLSRAPSKEWFRWGFPFGEATRLMIDLAPERDRDKPSSARGGAVRGTTCRPQWQ
jgi:hypothetical protein